MDRAGRLQLIGSVVPADGEIPVPKGRAHEAYCAALEGWKRPPGTRLHLGLLRDDDEAGNCARITVARRFSDDFGRSAECGWGRTAPGRLPGFLEAHRVAAEAL